MRPELLTAHFYEWEILGRGWLLGEEPVHLEPEFFPFAHYHNNTSQLKDDGVSHTLLSKVVSAFKAKKPELRESRRVSLSYKLYSFTERTPLRTFRLIISREAKMHRASAVELLIMLGYCELPVSFEIGATNEEIFIQFTCPERYASYLNSQIQAFCPGATTLEMDSDLAGFINFEHAIATVDYGLRDEFMRSIASKEASLDPFTGLFSVFEALEANEQVFVQVLFVPTVNEWRNSILHAVTINNEQPFFANAPEMLPMAREKIASPLFAVTVRAFTQAENLDAAFLLLEKISFTIAHATRSPGNTLAALTDQAYSFESRITDIVSRQSHRSGMLLNVHELATLVHIPDQTLRSHKLLGQKRKTKNSPMPSEGEGMLIGINEHSGISKKVVIPVDARLQHTHIIGATGTGKSTLLLSMITQDIAMRNSIAVLDPHGDLIEKVLQVIPHDRMYDVLIIDPSDSEYPVGLNILQAQSEIEKEVLSSDLVSAFKRHATTWGDQMNSVLSNAIMAFLENTRPGTLATLRRFLIEKQYREQVLQTVTDASIRYYWQKEYPLLKTNSIGPILTRLDSFLRPRVIRNMVSQEKGIDFETLLGSNKIILVKLSQGLIGNENSYLLGSFIVAKIQQAILSRQATSQRKNAFLYIDEFHHFLTPSLTALLSGARKYQLGLVLAHQDMQQLQRNDLDVAQSITANAGTRICFRLGEGDAKRLAEGFVSFDAQDLQNLEQGEVIARVERPSNDFSLSVHPVELPSTSFVDEIIQASRGSYATPKATVESTLEKHFGAIDDPKSKDVTEKVKAKIVIAPIPKIPQKESVRAVDESIIDTVATQKEESQHRHLQNLIKRMAESKGYKASLEIATPDRQGKVDVLLEKEHKTIACEISVTTETTWELHNLSKCVAANYDVIVSCSTNETFLKQMLGAVKAQFSSAEQNRIYVMKPENLIQLLDQMQINSSTEPKDSLVKGYRVHVSYDTISQEALNRKQESITRVVYDALKKRTE
jgi:hypothetical protein